MDSCTESPSSAPSAAPRCSILIVGYNSPDDIRVLLAGLRELPSWSTCEVLIAENGSDRISEMQELARDFGARLLTLPNPGFGTACNRLAAIARGEVVLLANPDLRFHSDIIPALCARLESPGTGSVGPLLLDEDGKEQISWNLPMGLWWEFLEAIGLQTRWRRSVMRRMRAEHPEGPWNVGFSTAGCLAIKRSVYERLGGFDEAFFLNSEDIELGDRIRALGLQPVVDPSLAVFHGNSAIQGRNLARFVCDRLDGKWVYLSRRYRGARLLVARLLWFKQVLIRLVVGFATLRGLERTRLPGYATALFNALGLSRAK